MPRPAAIGVTCRPHTVYNIDAVNEKFPKMRGVPVRAVLLVGVGAMALVWAGGLPAGAEPLEATRISADAKWLAHIDLDAVRAAGLAQKAHDVWLTRQPAKRKLEEFRKTFGIDLTQDIHSISFYGARLVPHSGVAIVRARMDRSRLLGLLTRASSHRTASYGDHTLHTWTQAKGKKDEHTVTGCFHQATVAVFGRDADEVKAALDVLDGKSPDLAGSDSPLKIDVPAGAMFVAGAIDLAEADLPFKSPVVRQTELLAVAVGEHEGQVFARARLVTGAEEVAQQMQAAVVGLRAVALLQHGDRQELARAVQALEVTQDEKTVTVQWRMSVEDVLKLIEKQWTQRNKPKSTD